MKQAQSADIGKLQMIVLFDSEANHGFKWLGAFTMKLAIVSGEMALEQYSCPGRSAIDHALNRRFTFDHYRYCRLLYALACSDLASCYDRVVHAAVSLALQ